MRGLKKRHIPILRKIYNHYGRKPFTFIDMKTTLGIEKSVQGQLVSMQSTRCIKAIGVKKIRNPRGFRTINIYKITLEMANYLKENPVSESSE